jgi:hypothetical protein
MRHVITGMEGTKEKHVPKSIIRCDATANFESTKLEMRIPIMIPIMKIPYTIPTMKIPATIPRNGDLVCVMTACRV